MRGDRERHRAVARAELLHHQRDRQEIELGAAVLVRDGESGQAERGELRQELERKLALLVPCIRVRDDPRPHEVADRVADENLVVSIGKPQNVAQRAAVG